MGSHTLSGDFLLISDIFENWKLWKAVYLYFVLLNTLFDYLIIWLKTCALLSGFCQGDDPAFVAKNYDRPVYNSDGMPITVNGTTDWNDLWSPFRPVAIGMPV